MYMHIQIHTELFKHYRSSCDHYGLLFHIFLTICHKLKVNFVLLKLIVSKINKLI